jgi:hypothetical protein
MLEIRPVLPDDYNRLAAFLVDFPRETRGGHFWLRRFNHWWDDNPAFVSGTERGWVLHQKNGNILGFLGVVSSRLRLLGQETRAFGTTTWRVLPEYRTDSLKLFFKAMSTAKKSVLFCTTPSGQVNKILEPLRFQAIPRLDNDASEVRVERSVIITNVDKFLTAKLASRMRWNLVTKVAVSSLSVPLRIWQSYRSTMLITAGVPTATRVNWAHRGFDHLWMRTENAYLNTNVRSADVINWYCFANANYAKELFGCFRGDEVLGYAIFWRKDRPQLKTFECVDLWVDPAEPAVIASLVRSAGEYAKDNYVDLVVFPHFTGTLKEHFDRLGLLRLKFPRRREYFKSDARITPEINERNSYFVGCQGDYGL